MRRLVALFWEVCGPDLSSRTLKALTDVQENLPFTSTTSLFCFKKTQAGLNIGGQDIFSRDYNVAEVIAMTFNCSTAE